MQSKNEERNILTSSLYGGGAQNLINKGFAPNNKYSTTENSMNNTSFCCTFLLKREGVNHE